MEQILVPVITVAGGIITTLLGWIGWLIKKRLEDGKKSTQDQEEMKILIEQFVQNQDVTMAVIRCLVKGMQITLKSDDLQFQSAHESGLMNGESVEQRKVIQEYFDEVKEMGDKLDKIYVNPLGTENKNIQV